MTEVLGILIACAGMIGGLLVISWAAGDFRKNG